MKIIKRNGSEAVFDISKIIAAVTKANNVVASNQRLTKEQITAIADDVAQECQSRNHAMNVEEIQDLVEDAIMQTKAYEVARKYITYRYVQSLRRTHNTTDDRILSLIECNNEEVKQENANKKPDRQQRSARLYGRRGQQGPDHAYAAACRDCKGT